MKKKLMLLGIGLLIGWGGYLALGSITVKNHQLASAIAYFDNDYTTEETMPDEEATTAPETLRGASIVTMSEEVHVPIFVYHSVRPSIKGESAYQDAYDVTPELLEQELSYLTEHGYHSISFSDLHRYFTVGKALPEKSVILSFDDGWKNQYMYAFPLLKKYHLTGTFFIFTNPLDNEKSHWVSWKEVAEMDRAGMEIGGHTRTHPILTKLKDSAALDSEIAGGKKKLESHLGHPIDAFAYPFGQYNDSVVEAVERAGYLIARTTHKQGADSESTRYLVHGTLVNDSLEDFIKELGK